MFLLDYSTSCNVALPNGLLYHPTTHSPLKQTSLAKILNFIFSHNLNKCILVLLLFIIMSLIISSSNSNERNRRQLVCMFDLEWG